MQELIANLKEAASDLLQNGKTKQGLAVQACVTMLEDDSEDGPTEREKTLALLVKRLCRRLAPEDMLREGATDYLRREGLLGSPLRAGDAGVTTCPGCQRGPDCAETCAALGVEGRTEYGWLIENGKQQGAGLAYRYIDNDSGGIPGWTEDPNKALRFARREDAEQFAHHDEDAWRIVEHVWDSPGVGVAPATFDKPLNTEPPSKCEFPACAVHHICSRNCERNAGVKERERG